MPFGAGLPLVCDRLLGSDLAGQAPASRDRRGWVGSPQGGPFLSLLHSSQISPESEFSGVVVEGGLTCESGCARRAHSLLREVRRARRRLRGFLTHRRQVIACGLARTSAFCSSRPNRLLAAVAAQVYFLI